MLVQKSLRGPARCCPAPTRRPGLAQTRVPTRSLANPSQGQTAPAPAALDTLRCAAVKPGAVRPSDVLAAMLTLEKAKLKPEGWEAALTAPGARWQLVYTASSKDVTAAAKGTKGGAGGYFPLAACQKFEGGEFENGVFFGPVGHLTFKGPFQMDGRLLRFDVSTMHLGLGPWRLALPLKSPQPLSQMEPKTLKRLPFFVYAHVGPDVIVARGQSGGLALWRRAETEWLASSGALQVYK